MTQRDIDLLLHENGMHPADIDMAAELQKFKEDFFRGLVRDNPSSMMMLPSFIPVTDAVQKDRPIIAVDAGGTNLRVALVRFDDGGMKLDAFDTYPMPGTGGAVPRELFFQTLAEYLLPYADKSDTVGFCFSYPFLSLPDRDAEALPLCKEVEVTGIEGAHVGAETEAALRALGAGGSRRYTLINDTVAAMLAGALASSGGGNYDGYVGLILGTGLNTCCAVDVKAIKKADVSGFAHDRMIINMESGNYSGFPRGSVDIALDAASNATGDHAFEKMVSGAYMGAVILGTLKLAAKSGVFSGACRERVLALEGVRLKHVDRYLAGITEDNPIASLPETPEDVELMGGVIGLLYARAAKLLAVALCGILECADCGSSPERPACVCAEGTTFDKSLRMRELLDIFIKDFVNAGRGRYLEFVKVENATLAGTAVAGMLD